MDVPSLEAVEVGPVTRVAGRDADALLTAAYQAHRDEIFSFLARTMRDDGEAEDLLQDTFLRLSREARAGRVPDQLRAWLYRVATNLAMSRFRRRGVAARWLERFKAAARDPQSAESPEAHFVGRERFHEMERALAVLPGDARTALLLAGQGFSGREIARSLGRTDGATRTLMSRARIRVRAELEGGPQ